MQSMQCYMKYDSCILAILLVQPHSQWYILFQ